jgi:hypothetical protein
MPGRSSGEYAASLEGPVAFGEDEVSSLGLGVGSGLLHAASRSARDATMARRKVMPADYPQAGLLIPSILTHLPVAGARQLALTLRLAGLAAVPARCAGAELQSGERVMRRN